MEFQQGQGNRAMEEKKKMTPKVKQQYVRMAVTLSVLLLLALLVWGYNLFRLRHVTYEGLTRYTEEEFTKKLQGSFIQKCTPFFCMESLFREKEIPFIEAYEIKYEGRNSAKVIVYEKRVVGCIPLMGRYMYFDKDGMIVESSTKWIEEIPIVEGLEFTEIALYKKLQIQKQSLFGTILALTGLIEDNGLNIEKIKFSSDYQVTLVSGMLEIQLGKQNSYDEQINALPGILKAAEGKSGTLDMRRYSKENKEFILKP